MMSRSAFFAISILTGAISATVDDAGAQVFQRGVNPAAYAADDVSDQVPYGSMHIMAAPAETGTVFAPPAGNVIFKSQGTSSCTNLNTAVTELAIFEVDFNTAHASSYIEVNYSGQFSLNASAQLNRIFLNCSVAQGATSVPCSGIFTQGYSMARRVLVGGSPPTYAAVTNSGSYVGYVYVGSDGSIKPNTLTTVKILAKFVPTSGFSLDGTGSICFSNLIVRY